MSKYIIGIDVSKKKLDAFCSYDKVKRSFDNNESGIKELCTWLQPMEKPVVVHEPTAHHHRDLEARMMAKKIDIVRADPYRVRKFAEAKGQLAKSDDIDAEMIASAAIALELPCTQIKEKELQQLQELCTQRRALIQQRAALSNMTKTLTMPELINNNNNLHGELARLALQQGCKLQELGGGLDFALDLGFGDAANFQAVRHVLRYVHVRIKRVVLEDHGDVAVHGLFVVGAFAVDE